MLLPSYVTPLSREMIFNISTMTCTYFYILFPVTVNFQSVAIIVENKTRFRKLRANSAALRELRRIWFWYLSCTSYSEPKRILWTIYPSACDPKVPLAVADLYRQRILEMRFHISCRITLIIPTHELRDKKVHKALQLCKSSFRV